MAKTIRLLYIGAVNYFGLDGYIMKRVILLVCTLFLLGCHTEMSPLVSGEVIDGGLFLGKYTVKDENKAPRSWSLSKAQLQSLSSWLKLHQSDWNMILASPPPPSYSVLIAHMDGSHSQIDFYSINESWRHAVHIAVRDKDEKFVFGGSMNLPSKDIASLKTLLNEAK